MTELSDCKRIVEKPMVADYQAKIDGLHKQLARANRIIGWMCPYIGTMCPPDGGLAEFNDHTMDNYIPPPGEDTKGAPLKQRRQV